MAEMANAFDNLVEFDMWEQVLATLAGFFAPTVLQNLVGGVVPDAVDEPEAYGLAVMAGGQFAPAYENELSMGGGLYTADKAAERFGVKSTIVEAGA
jgi:hypothetical protein